eukprot:scaffold56384_cov70-Phaeocystis_antarctica.AAC.2
MVRARVRARDDAALADGAQRAHRKLCHVLAALVRHRSPADVERRLLARLDELDERGGGLLG